MSAFDQELSSTIMDVEKQLNALANFSAADTRERLVKIEQKVKQLSSTLHHLQTEIRNTEDRKLAQQLTQAASQHDKKIKEIRARVKEIKDQLQGGSPNGGAAAGGTTYSPRNDGKDGARKTAQNIENLQNAALASLKRTQATVEETKEIGNEATSKLKQQTEQLHRINEKLDHLESEVNRGKKELSAFIRRMMTDKILICFLFLIVVAVIVVIVLKVKNPFEESAPRTDGTTTTTTHAPGPSPVGPPPPPVTPTPDSPTPAPAPADAPTPAPPTPAPAPADSPTAAPPTPAPWTWVAASS